ncbi:MULTISPECIES: site-specific DNA-methyltransferase [Bacillus]|uniref:DNA-methyltransferase n=1 Tax=Bacillus TaxID=1386 RepID=UPI0009D908BE|nr:MULTISPECIES: site-specific DNA-methyltransferase [Bacillus]PEB95361.1 site-specific DNA-methyltransferase [Bacillus cereus]PEC27539.1 site-specific DNA-methyltransferase [Bacillus thuringiensis]PEQ71473.1 site-specific DNA-methyltransferase [Bacillus cereus]PFZ17439.1 site-specific DNA-methyltransferase [Bacillus thuringiensis]SMD40397.1 site-specific DNA-methyltransferase (cytosine-N4-specific) [Bacillus sp. JKS001846]
MTRFPFNIPNNEPVFTTEYGKAYCSDSIKFMENIPDNSVDLIMTSPPFALLRKKKYGNEESSDYVKWFIDNFASEFWRILKPTGSLVIDIGGTWNKGEPTRSLYHFELLLQLCSSDIGFHLAQEFYWYNPSKLPSPIQWVNIKRVRVKDSINPVWWLSKTKNPKANNRNVLTPYKASMKKLFTNGYNDGPRPSGHHVSKKWGTDNGGAIPPNLIGYEEAFDYFNDNLLEISNTRSNDKYLNACKILDKKPHPARFPKELPSFFVNFLTDEGDVIYDPFGGSCVTGEVAENSKRNWITSEILSEYVETSRYRFEELPSLNKDTND